MIRVDTPHGSRIGHALSQTRWRLSLVSRERTSLQCTCMLAAEAQQRGFVRDPISAQELTVTQREGAGFKWPRGLGIGMGLGGGGGQRSARGPGRPARSAGHLGRRHS